VPIEDLGEGLVDRSEQGVDGAVALGARLPVVIARLDDDRATTLLIAAGRHGPASEVERFLLRQRVTSRE
jgi:hypothetical protein